MSLPDVKTEAQAREAGYWPLTEPYRVQGERHETAQLEAAVAQAMRLPIILVKGRDKYRRRTFTIWRTDEKVSCKTARQLQSVADHGAAFAKHPRSALRRGRRTNQ